jgi:hypothetical protein
MKLWMALLTAQLRPLLKSWTAAGDAQWKDEHNR